MGLWTLTFGEETRSLAGWGMSQCVISEQALTAGMLTATVPGNMLATLPWGFEDVITLKLDGVVKFKGVALSPKRMGSGVNQHIQLRFADPWWYLAQGTYVQPWWVKASGTAYDAPRCALFADISIGEGWVKRTVGESIGDIITQCNAYFGGSVMQLGDLLGDGFDAQPIPQRVNNVTYESVLRQALAWVPDAVQRWDYTTTPPTMHLVQRSEATARSYAINANGVMVEQDFLKRDDLVVRGIEITYAGLDAFGNVVKVIDQAGETTGTRLLKTVIDCTGNANGAAATSPTSTPEVTRQYTVVSEAIEMTPAWWFKYGDTGALSAADIVVGDGSSVAFAPAAPENAGKTDLGGCGLQWLEGGMPKSRLSANTRVALVTGNLTIRTTKVEDSGAAPITTTEVQERRIVKMLMPVTKLSGDYEQRISEASSSIGGGIPQLLSPIYLTPGLADKLLAALGQAQFDGTIRLAKNECDEPVMLGDVINVTGGLAEWTDMGTQVHALTREIDTGVTTIQTGVAEYLGVDEYANLLRMSRMRTVPAMDLDQQATGQVPANEPDPDELDDLVGPGAVKYSVLKGPQKMKIITSTAVRLVDMTADGGPTDSNKNTTSGDEVVTTPGKQTVRNEAAAKSNESTPDKLSLKDGATDKAELTVANGLELTTETKTAQLKAGLLSITGESGFSITLSPEEGLLMIDAGVTVQLKPGLGLVISDGTSSTTLNLLELLHNNGSGKTMNVNEEQIVINNGTRMMVIAPEETTMQDGDGFVLSLKPSEVRITDGGDYSSMTTEGGFRGVYDGTEVKLYLGQLKLQQDGSSIVEIVPVTGKNIQLRETASCVDEGGVPTPKKAHYLRSLPVSV
jgi:hypothetical protein